MATFYKAIIKVPTFTVDGEAPFNLDISDPISEVEESEDKKSNGNVEPKVEQMILNKEFQNYVYIANSLNYRNQLHQLNRDPMFDKNFYLQNIQ